MKSRKGKAMFRFPLRGSSAKTPLPVSETERYASVVQETSDSPDVPEGDDAEAYDDEDDAEYQAFSAVANSRQVDALWLRCVGGQEHVMLDYAWRRMVRYDGLGCALTLVFADCTVRLLGRKLGELMKKLQNRKVEWVQMYDPARWPQPAPGQPIITAIVVEFAAEKQKKPSSRLRLVEKEERDDECDAVDFPDEMSAGEEHAAVLQAHADA